MKRTLLIALALIAIPPVALEAQDPFTLSVSEYMEMDDAERYAFNGYVVGLYQMSTDEGARRVRDCLEEWRTKSPDTWLLALNGWMYDAVSFGDLGSTEAELIAERERVQEAQQEWQNNQNLWNLIRDTLQKLTTALEQYNRGEATYVVLFGEWNDFNGELGNVERQMNQSFENLTSLQEGTIVELSGTPAVEVLVLAIVRSCVSP
ncbi:MAG TPA: hypothetical protein EYM97_03730 [Gemmatimonadetes bacterium]|jgi:chromosome segregation ATPase|nr:hypothetical protein [Gemmatimonadota bacterium]